MEYGILRVIGNLYDKKTIMNNMQKWHNTMMTLHYEPSEHSKMIDRNVELRNRQYAKWSEAHPDHTREEGEIKFMELHDALVWDIRDG